MAETGKTKTHCIGRLLVEVPEEFEVLRHDGTVRETRIERIGPGTERDAERLYEERVRALRNGEVSIDTVKMLYRDVGRIGALRTVSMLIDWTDGGFQPQEPWREETYVSSEGTIFHLETSMDNGNADAARSDIQAVADAIHPRTAGDIPAGEGTCLEHAFLNLPQGRESMGALFRMPGSIVGIEVGLTIVPPGEAKLELEGAESNIGDPIEIAGLRGRVAKDYGSEHFFYATVGQQASQNDFGYSIDLSFFDRRADFGSAPFTRKDADHIWDTLIQSVRIKK
ncbi:hypothetical protein K3725_17570 [Leisingera sp. S132]|uniref:hypothetical protein n=1 Tax=Leisingera sp. S132 TaxID=2867016 RepID=UPI0021A8BD18|nr:hypothetical protein [Leisingera sp. S132]UWQ79082.1 hypothetical protein K3725_17570 [Leisingera sp. S132]